MKNSSNFATLLERFFLERLLSQRQASPHTVAAYRDSFRLLLQYAQNRLRTSPSSLKLKDLDAPFVGSFLDHLEKERGNSTRTRNARLAAIHSFFHYVALQAPDHAGQIQQVLAIPAKKCDRALVSFLTRPEIDALLSAPDRNTWAGRRDHALMLVAVTTGLRVSELTGLRRADVSLGKGAHVRCQGKGRKERCTPLGKQAAREVRAWLQERNSSPADPLFPNARGGTLSRDGVQYLLVKHLKVARLNCPTLEGKRVSPHVLRHANAMQLLLAGVDRSVIALWLGHESVETTQMYLDANLAMKEKLVDKIAPTKARAGRYRPGDQVLEFLKSL